MWTIKPLLLALVFALVTPYWIEARCFRDLAFELRMAKQLEKTPGTTVFRGTVLDVRKVRGGQVATIDADRVWLGRVPKQVTLFNLSENPDGQDLTAGARYIIFTREHSPEVRQLFGTMDAGTYGTQGCGIWVADQHNARVLGKGHEVKASTSSR